jgi:hypothetical protein
MMKSVSGFVIAILLGVVAPSGRAHAAFMTYTEQVTGSGTLNGVAFTTQLVTLTYAADTANIVNNGSGFFTLTTGTATLQVDGGATGTFIAHTFGVYTNVNINAGFYDVQQSATILATQSPAVGNFALASPISVSGPTFIRPDITFSTSLGAFVLSSTSTNATFTASASVPEPSSLALCGVAGLTGLAFARRSRKRPA